MTLLAVDRLSITFGTPANPLPIVRDVSFELARGGTLGIVGESGSGKSMTALSLIGLLPDAARVGGSILFDGTELANATEATWLPLRGWRIGFVFQEPMTSLNPVHTIGRQIAESLILHGLKNANAARAEALRLLDRVRLPRAAERLDAYPHELSGGQRQRVMIAIAIACNPALLIADEPTSALDVTVQRQIVALLQELQTETGMGLIVISHDLGVIADLADRSIVLYGGRIMEEGPTRGLFATQGHPYTRGLIAARPGRHLGKGARLPAIPGNVPAAADFAPGCPFFGRCSIGREDVCRDVPPPPVAFGQTVARCYFTGGRT
jgi:peptide/nickel transport system ATP-binding protein